MSTDQPRPYRPQTWLIWLCTLAAVTMLLRNPIYSMLIVFVAITVGRTSALTNQGIRLSLLRLGLLMVLFSAVFNIIFVHLGTHILVTLPPWPLIGGIWTIEALLAGAANGLMLFALLTVFITFNQLIAITDLARMIPAAFHDLGIVLLIALTFIPQTQQHMQQVREAQALRGHHIRGLRDWRPLLLPLLIGGLERAFQLAEAMVARGYGHTDDTAANLSARICIVVGLTLILIGWLLAIFIASAGWLLAALGGAIVIWLVWSLGSRHTRTTYRTHRLTSHDIILSAICIVAFIILLWQRATLFWQPFPTLIPPPFNPWLALAVLTFALPAVYPARE